MFSRRSYTASSASYSESTAAGRDAKKLDFPAAICRRGPTSRGAPRAYQSTS